EVTERLAGDGSVVEPLSEADVIAAGRALVDEGIEAVGIAFINSYRNAAHERQAEAVLQRHFPQLLTTTSCAVLPEMKEYE
uniref:hydantoinase/oxoprolinase N-terminal domain-containing protein n=1 Tax=Stenotrophomonas maltophilia TaxID=40324 RepID=UPI0023B81EC8